MLEALAVAYGFNPERATKEEEYADIYSFDNGEVHLCEYEETENTAG